MEALEFLKKLTANGTQCRLPTDKASQITNTTGSDPFNTMSIVTYQSDAALEGKSANKILTEITLTAINSDTWDEFIEFAIELLPKNYRENNASNDAWEAFYRKFTKAIANRLTQQLIVDRHFPGASMWLKTLTTRIKSWQKSVKAEIKQEGTESKSIAISFSLEG